MAKLKSPLKMARTGMDLSRGELASLAFPSRDDHVEKTQLANAIARCEAGLLEPEDDASLKFLFDRLAGHGYKSLMEEQQAWVAERANAEK